MNLIKRLIFISFYAMPRVIVLDARKKIMAVLKILSYPFIALNLVSCADLAGGVLLQVSPVSYCMNNYTFIQDEKERRAYCEGEFMRERNGIAAQAKAMDLEEKKKFEQSSSAKALNTTIQTLQGISNSTGVKGSIGMDTSMSCKGKANCEFQMPSVACGKYTKYSYVGGYSFEQTNVCSHDILYKLTIYQGPQFSPYGGYQASPRLRPNEKFRGNSLFSQSNSIKVVDDYSCRTKDDVSRMVGMSLSRGGAAANASIKSGCYYETSSNAVGTGQ